MLAPVSRRRAVITGLTLAACVATVGCGGSSRRDPKLPETHPVSGSVLANGSPVAGALVTFIPDGGSGRGAFATTDAQGRFSLQTYDPGDGAVPGPYKVIVSKSEPSKKFSEAELQAFNEKGVPPPNVQQKDLLPIVYKDATKTPLKAEVKAGSNELPPFEVGK